MIAALAKASGHNLVRINLSEQTDISDLMGSDVPYSGDTESDSSPGASFRWCDGVFLKAIKQGDWVLLDELNLASQSVLEGLNSCLDHRASVYIPELGQTFACPPSFRIFAAQNPLAQGGGRKGLPKSFLNRFTKVYIEALTNEDLFNIVTDQFPTVPTSIVEKMISFNDRVQHDIDSRLYGQHGSPWEFNLRDVFRWCQLLTRSGLEMSLKSAAKYADILYTQRLRIPHDRMMIGKRVHDHFGDFFTLNSHPKLEVTSTGVLIGDTLLDRFTDTAHWSDVPLQDTEPDIAQSLLSSMEAVACCVRMDWSCLLVGPASSGKSALLKTLADACNVHIETLAMTSSTDVTELIGCFEQTDSMGNSKEILKSMKRMYDGACLACKIDTEMLQTLNTHYWVMNKEIMHIEGSKSSLDTSRALLTAIEKLIECFVIVGQQFPAFSTSFSRQIIPCQQWLSSHRKKSSSTKGKSPFQWVDGILVQAMEKGYWLHLENVNFCPSSVLDRLNPLMEFGGELVMTECGISDDTQNAKSRVIKPHHNFRLFLSMNPNSHGEVSRAMRNRCIEVCLLPPSFGTASPADAMPLIEGADVETIDALACLWSSDVRTHVTGQSMFSAHKLDFQRCVELHDDPPTIKTIKDWGTLFSGLLKRGMAMLSLPVSHRLLYEIHENDHCQHNFMTLSSSPSLSGLIKGISTRRDLEFDPAATRILKESRLLRMMTGDDKHEHASEALNYFDSKRQPLNEHHKHETRAHLRFQSICRLAETVPLCDFQYLASSMDGFCLTSASQIKVMVTILNDVFLKTGCGEFNSSETLSTIFNSSLGPSNDSAGTSDCSPVQGTDRIATLHAVRIPHLLEEAVTYYQLYHTNAIPTHCEMNVIAMSYYVNKKQTEAPFVGCPVTPQIFPLFRIVDDFFGAWQNESHCLSASKKQVMALEFALLCRDRLWQCLKRSQYLGARSNSLIGFDFTGFFTQYCWFKKSLSTFILLVQDETKSGTILASLLRRLHLSLETIDEAIQESMGGSISSSDILWKRGGHPLLPSSIVNFEELNKLKDISKSCALVKEESFGFTRLVSSQGAISIDLRNLIATNHPILFVQKQFHTELLGALAMTFWAATDEMREISAKDYNISSAPKVLQCSFQHAKEDFVADINFATIDTSIKTVDNALDLDTIKSMTGENSVGKKNSDDFIQHLILRFGEIQASQIGEIWCISDEAAIIGMLSHVLCQYQDPKQFGLIKDLRRHCHDSIVSFIAKASSHTQWPIEDLRPYQTLLWALESKLTTDDSIKRIISCVLPRMFHSFFNHQWCNSYNDLDSISCNLLGPSLWNKEDQESQMEFESSSLDSSAKSILLPNCAGPCRTELNVHRTAIFRLLRLPADGANGPFFTMENGDARKAQARKLLSLFARYAPRDDKLPPTVVIKYLLGNVFSVFQDVFQGENIDITKLLNSPPSNSSDVAVVLKSCQHNAFQTHFSKLMIPLVETLQLLNVTKEGSLLWKRSVSRAWIYVGLLRLHLVIPSSPIDPGRKPAAKVEQLNWFLGNLSSNLRSYSLHFGLSSGEFNPDSSMTKKLVAQGEIASRKRISQEKKIIERPSNASPFLDLFREIHHFCKTVATVDNVLALADLIENPCPETSFRSQEVNWQCSATAFCNRLSTFYSMYEDVTIPCMNEIRILQRGLRELALSNVESSQFYPVVQTQDKLLEYPFRNNVFSPNITEESLSNVLRDMLLQFGVNKGNGAKHDTAMIHQSYLLATLVRLQLYLKMHNLTNVNSSILGDLNVMFSSLANSSRFDTEEDKRTQSEGHTTVDESEQNEKVLREYFPDHGAEFERIIRAVDDDDEDTDMGVNEEEEVGARTQISQLSDFELSLVVSLHEDLFSGSQRKLDDNLRVRAFITSYEAASRLGQLTEWMRTTHDDSASMGAHMMALALRCNVHRRLWSPTLSGDSVSDFHNDPSPAESVKADIPLRALLIRVGQLLRAFPGHSILVALGQVVERVRQLDIQVVPLGKIMSGLEVILRKAQDWEQHASQYVLLGKPLQDIGSLVASLRKLELQSWSCLLTTRERRRSMRATRHWPNLYRLIHNTSSLEESKTTNSKLYARSTSSPSWVWKGFPKISERLAVDGDTKSIDDLVKVFDTFILTSDLSQFWSRLGLIKSFVNELRNECEVLGLKRFPLTRMLHSFWNYYSRFTPLLTRKKDSLREPIEKRLKDEVKLAKWDEQSYYALVSVLPLMFVVYPNS